MRLRQLEEKDLDGMLEWMHDVDIQKSFRHNMQGIKREDALRFIQEAVTEPIQGKSIHYAIANDKDEYMGTISLKEVDLTDRNAEYAISLRKIAQGRGIAFEATKLLLKKAFEFFEFERVYLNVLSENTRAIHLYEKCGFVFEGEFRNHLFLGGGYKTLKWYGMLNEDYQRICETLKVCEGHM